MLRHRLRPASGLLAVSLIAVLAACGGGDDGDGGGAIEENVVEPGITAIDDATRLACDGDADTLRAAIEQFELLEGSTPDSEAALVATGYLKEESERFDVVDGRLEAVDQACKGSVPATTPNGSVPLTAPATDLGQIITNDQVLTAAEVFATMTADDIAAFGGEACARELADIFAAGEAFTAREGREPENLDDLESDLESPVTRWAYDGTDDRLVPADGSPCPDVFAESATG